MIQNKSLTIVRLLLFYAFSFRSYRTDDDHELICCFIAEEIQIVKCELCCDLYVKFLKINSENGSTNAKFVRN